MTDSPEPEQIKIEIDRLSFFYGPDQALEDINMEIPARRVTALIGPSGCGKSTLLRCINRMNDIIEGVSRNGRILIDGNDIFSDSVHVDDLRKRVGMVFQKPNPFPKSIFDNVAYGPRVHGVRARGELADIVEKSLKEAALWEEVKDRLHSSALALSGGQQQRLCIARALAVNPEILLMDEPTSALDPRSTAWIEELIEMLRSEYTIVIVTHNMQQAGRVSDLTGFLLDGKLIELGNTKELFMSPQKTETEDYITGRFG